MNLIQRLDTWLKRYRSNYYESLRSPLSDAEIAEFESLFAVSFPEDFKALYQWKNGQKATVDESLYQNRNWMQMREIQYAIEPNNEFLDTGEFESGTWWSRKWIPFLGDEMGNYLCLDLEGCFNGHPGQLITFSEDRPQRNIEYPDLHTFLSSLLSGYEALADSKNIPESIEIPYPPGYPILNKAR